MPNTEKLKGNAPVATARQKQTAPQNASVLKFKGVGWKGQPGGITKSATQSGRDQHSGADQNYKSKYQGEPNAPEDVNGPPGVKKKRHSGKTKDPAEYLSPVAARMFARGSVSKKALRVNLHMSRKKFKKAVKAGNKDVKRRAKASDDIREKASDGNFDDGFYN